MVLSYPSHGQDILNWMWMLEMVEKRHNENL